MDCVCTLQELHRMYHDGEYMQDVDADPNEELPDDFWENAKVEHKNHVDINTEKV